MDKDYKENIPIIAARLDTPCLVEYECLRLVIMATEFKCKYRLLKY